jgi:flagellar hook assembly protein FlgD
MISYDLKTDSKVSLKVYNILGQEVTTLVDKYQPVGSYTVAWNGKDSRGNDLSTGVYFYILKAGDFSANKKMTYLK